MEGLDITVLEELRKKLESDLLNPETKKEDKPEIRQELDVVTKAIKGFYQLQNVQDKFTTDREKMEADIRIAEIEADARIRQAELDADARIKQAELDAEARSRQAEIELNTEIVKGGFGLAATGLGGFFMGKLAKKIVDREDDGELLRSSADWILQKICRFK